jgi:3-oxoacyl-[acyl-carrier-protein] synthase-1
MHVSDSSVLEVVAVGARVPVGLSAETAAAAIRAGVNRIREHPHLLDGAGEPLRCGRDPLLEPGAYGVRRKAALAEDALRQVLEVLQPIADPALPVLLAAPEQRPGFDGADARTLLDRLAGCGSNIEVHLAGRGHAGVFEALARASTSLAKKQHRICIVGGVDSYLHADTLNWLDEARRIHRSDVRAGFLPGEGAAMLALTLVGSARRLGLRVLGRVRSVATAIEQRSFDSDEGLLGEGLSQAVREATAALEAGEPVHDVYADINGERHRSEEWAFTLLRHPRCCVDGSVYVNAAEQCGDVGAATGALQIALALRAWHGGYARGPRALAFAGSWQGTRGVAVLEAEQA